VVAATPIRVREASGDPTLGRPVVGEMGRGVPDIVVASGDLIWAAFRILHLSQALSEPGQFPQYPFKIAHEAIL